MNFIASVAQLVLKLTCHSCVDFPLSVMESRVMVTGLEGNSRCKNAEKTCQH